jgi:hypothetical protein
MSTARPRAGNQQKKMFRHFRVIGIVNWTLGKDTANSRARIAV